MIDLTIFEEVTVGGFIVLAITLSTFYFKVVRPIDRKLSTIVKHANYNVVIVKALRAICRSIIDSPIMNNDEEVKEAWDALSDLTIEQANQTKE